MALKDGVVMMLNGDDPEGELERLTSEAASAGRDRLEELRGSPTLAGQAQFCGCSTCVVREVLRAAFPFMMCIAILHLENGRRVVQHVSVDGGQERGH